MKTFKKIILAAAIVAAGIATGVQAETITGHPASLIGETVTPSVNGQASSQFTVAANRVEFGVPGTVWYWLLPQYNNQAIKFDFGANALTITTPTKYSTATTWGDLGNVTFSGFDAFITGVNLASNQGFSHDFAKGISSFTDHSITFDWDSSWSQGSDSKLVFNITAVPEPGSVALLGLGLMGVIAARRKSSKNKNA
jgi:hypothetical protein